MKFKLLVVVLLFTSLFNSCNTTVKRLSDEGYMYAMIYDYDSLPVTGVAVYLNGIKVTDSDIQGRFVLEDMKPGNYRIRLVKRGYETFEDTFQYVAMQILYFRLINADQLLSLAELEMDVNEYETAEDFLNRALVLEPTRSDILFLAAIANNMQSKTNEAIDLLERIVRSGGADPSVLRLLDMLKQEEVEQDLQDE